MLTILNHGQSFGWDPKLDFEIKFINDIEEFNSSPNPKIIMLDTADQWYSYDREKADLTLFWSTEALSNERAEGKPIIKLHPNDRIFSSSIGPNNNHSLFWACIMMSGMYKKKYKFLIPKNEIFVNNICYTPGHGRITRVYSYLKLQEKNLINRNVSFATNVFIDWPMPDACNELPGQHEICQFLKKADYNTLKYHCLELDWRKNKNWSNWWEGNLFGTQSSAIIPTHAYLDSSLLLIHETIIHNPEFYITEKTCKGLLSGRPFIMIGCYKFLERLRNLGFVTWSSVLDESYDEIENIKDRIDRAIESANEFIKSNVLNDKRKLEKIRKITEHNKEVLFNTDWHKNIRGAKKQILLELGIY